MVGIISSMQALEVIKILLNIGTLAINKMVIVDGYDFSISTIPILKKDTKGIPIHIMNKRHGQQDKI